MSAPLPVDGADQLRALRERIVDLVTWFHEDNRRLPAAQSAWRSDELWDRRVEAEVERWQVLMDEGRPLPFASLPKSPSAGVLFELECLDLLAWFLPGAGLAPAPRFRRGDREYYLVRLARERTPHTARQAGLIYTHLRYHALVPTQIEIDAVRSYRVRIEPQVTGGDRWDTVRARGDARVATTSFGDGAEIEWRDHEAIGVPTADERVQKLARAIEEAGRAGIDILVAPELTIPPAARDRLLADLRWAKGPELALLVPGSFHERIGDRTVNHALLVDGKGNVLSEHKKLTMFGENDGWLESIALGDEIRVLVTPIGTVAIAICKDFCDYFVGRVWEQLQLEWLLVPAYGRGARAHEDAAARLARMAGTAVIVAHEGDRMQQLEANSFVHTTTLAKGNRYAPAYFKHAIELRSDIKLDLPGWFGTGRHRADSLAAIDFLPPFVYLNIRFPQHPGPATIVPVGTAARMLVNLAPWPSEGTFAWNRAEDAAPWSYEIDHVDVMAICPGADVFPLRKRLPLPPDTQAIVKFDITPYRLGTLELSVILLIDGESIHRSRTSLIATSSTGEAVPAVEREGESS